MRTWKTHVLNPIENGFVSADKTVFPKIHTEYKTGNSSGNVQRQIQEFG
jgi:hypothetical protein